MSCCSPGLPDGRVEGPTSTDCKVLTQFCHSLLLGAWIVPAALAARRP